MQNTAPMNDIVVAWPASHQATQDHRVQALLEIEELIERGTKVRDAVAKVSKKTGFGERTLYRYRQETNFVPRCDWSAALAPKWNPAHGMKASCHPAALTRFFDECRAGIGVSESYRRTVVEAKLKLWFPIPSERTLRRQFELQVDRSEVRNSRRDAQPQVSA